MPHDTLMVSPMSPNTCYLCLQSIQHPRRSDDDGHHQRDNPRLPSPAVEEGVHGGFLGVRSQLPGQRHFYMWVAMFS
jgi:hypothetical protein